MRLDKFLKVSRLIKRRSVANEACSAGKVEVNNRAVKASYDIKIGDNISIKLGTREINVQVISLQETVKKEDASSLYKIIET